MLTSFGSGAGNLVTFESLGPPGLSYINNYTTRQDVYNIMGVSLNELSVFGAWLRHCNCVNLKRIITYSLLVLLLIYR